MASGTQKPLKREDYLDDEDFFMASAILASKRSVDPSTRVGACIVSKKGSKGSSIVGQGFNCMPQRNEEMYKYDRETPKKNRTVCHAELNAIASKTCLDLSDCKMYTTLYPCNECAKIIVQSGIKEVIFQFDSNKDQVEAKAAQKIFETSNVTCRRFRSEKIREFTIDFGQSEHHRGPATVAANRPATSVMSTEPTAKRIKGAQQN